MLNVFEKDERREVLSSEVSSARSILFPMFSCNNICVKTVMLEEALIQIQSAALLQALVDVFNNVLREANQAGWTQLQTAGSGSQTLLQNAERFGRILGTSTVNGNGTLVLSRENIGEHLYVLPFFLCLNSIVVSAQY